MKNEDKNDVLKCQQVISGFAKLGGKSDNPNFGVSFNRQ